MSTYRVIIAAELTAWQHAHPFTLADNRAAAWVVGDDPDDAPVHESFATEDAARAAYPELPPLGRFAGQDDAPPVPQSVTRRQLFLVLNSLGVTRAMIREQIAGNEAALIEFDEALDFRRDHPLVAQLGQALGFTAAQIDEAFRSAAQL